MVKLRKPAAVTPFTCADVAACLEGDYTSWTLQWKKAVAADWGGTTFGTSLIQANEDDDKLLMWYEGGTKRAIAKLSDGTLIGTIDTVKSGGGAQYSIPMSFSRYYAEVVSTGTNYNLVIYKDGAVIQTIDLNAVLGITYTSGKYFLLTFTKDGKYLTVSGYTWYTASANLYVALFKGA